jgi:hypothetical protein
VFVGGDDCRIHAWDTDAPNESYIVAHASSYQQMVGSTLPTGPSKTPSFSVRTIGNTVLVEERAPRNAGIDRSGHQLSRGGPQAPLVRGAADVEVIQTLVFVSHAFCSSCWSLGRPPRQRDVARSLLCAGLPPLICRCRGRHQDLEIVIL